MIKLRCKDTALFIKKQDLLLILSHLKMVAKGWINTGLTAIFYRYIAKQPREGL